MANPTTIQVKDQVTGIPQTVSTLDAVLTLPIPTQAPTVSIGGVGIQDSTGAITAAVKAGLTAAVANDAAVVVALSPNSGVVGTIAAGSADSGNPVKVGGVYKSTQPTLTNGQRGDLLLSDRNSLIVETGIRPLDTSPAASSNTSNAANYTHVAAGQATTVIKASAGRLYAIIFNSKGTASNVTTIFDSTTGSGTVISIPDAANINAGTTVPFGTMGIGFSTGLTVLTATANGADMTFVWK
jgi:hypothetical protein